MAVARMAVDSARTKFEGHAWRAVDMQPSVTDFYGGIGGTGLRVGLHKQAHDRPARKYCRTLV